MKLRFQDINLNTLLHYHMIAKHRSLRQAAHELHLSAPAITHSLNNLEQSLNEVLCIRNRSEFALTAAGLSLYKTTQKIFAELEEFTSRQTDPLKFTGILSVGLLDHFKNHSFQIALEKVVKKFPDLKLNVQSYDSDTINQLLIEKEIDIGVGIFNHHSPRIKYSKIGEEKLSYYISKNHPLYSKKKISKEDLQGQKVTWLDNQKRKKSDLELNIFIENLRYKMQFFGFTNNLSGALQILLSGHSIVPLPELYGRSLETQHQARKLDVETKGKTLNEMLAFNPTAQHSPAAKMLIDILQN
jgi:LysR family transcriptional regulator, low CO2-responsive transcriptional regulator